MKSNLYNTIYLLLVISLGYVATDIYLPSLPALTHYFQASENEVQMTLFSYLISFAFTPLIFGPLSDYMGRKKVLLGGLIIGLLATLGCLFAGSIQFLIVARLFQGMGLGAVLIASRSAVSDLYIGQALAKQMSLITMLMPFILAVAPTLGGFLQQHFQWQAVFIFLACYMVFIMACITLSSESLKSEGPKQISQIFSSYRTHLKNRQFVAFGIIFVLPSIGFFAYMTVSPFLFQEVMGLTPVEYGSLALCIGGTILMTGYLNIKLIQSFPVTKILQLGTFLMILSGSLLLLFHLMGILTTWSLLIPVLIYFTSLPLCVSNAASKSLSFISSSFGSATALLTTIQFLVGSLSSLVFSLMADEMFLSLAIGFLAVGVFFLIGLKYACKLEEELKVQPERA